MNLEYIAFRWKKKNSVSKKKKTKKKKTFVIKIEELQYKNHLKTKFYTFYAFISASKAEDKLGSQCSHSEAPYILMIVSNQTENIWSITWPYISSHKLSYPACANNCMAEKHLGIPYQQ